VIGPGELLYGVPEAHIVNAAFYHPGPLSGRFNSSQRDARYAAVELDKRSHFGPRVRAHGVSCLRDDF
jgi:hypothetical protein